MNYINFLNALSVHNIFKRAETLFFGILLNVYSHDFCLNTLSVILFLNDSEQIY